MTRDADASLQRAVADACMGAGAGDAIASDLRGFLEARGVAAEDVEAILAAPRRLAVYRDLVRNGIGSIVVKMLPRTRARLDAARPGRFAADLAAFLEEAPPRTHYLRDVPAELLAWVEPRWKADEGVPPYLPDLARHELAHFAVGAAESARATEEPADVAIDHPLAFVDSARIVRYAWAVHELPADGADLSSPAARDVRLLVFRDEEHAVRWLDLTPLAAAILERLLGGEPLGAAVTGACAAAGVAPPDVLPGVARLLADLGSRGVVLGARQTG
jgi:uncharacterized protein